MRARMMRRRGRKNKKRRKIMRKNKKQYGNTKVSIENNEKPKD